jgi:tRNA A-37 threonylcarbamoyl transferase component Bud32
VANFDKTMTPGRWQRIKDALDAVLEVPPSKREAYLETHFADDPGLQREVRALLQADDAAESFLEEPAQDYARTLVQMQDRPAEDPLIGEVLDSYRMLGVLGRGGMGIVYKARDEDLDRIVAVKMIDPALARDDSFVRRFRTEAQALARIDSRHIVSVYALRKTERGLFIVMECVDGGTVSDLLEDGPVSLERLLPIVDQMLQAFEAAHGAGIVHRDIKPGNVMLTTDGVVKVTDFGLAKRVTGKGASMVTMTQGIAGTLHYMSPEQVQGLDDLDHRSDLYSAGMTIYQMLTGRLPIDRDSSEFEVMRSIVESDLPPPSHFNPDLSPEVDRVIMRSLEKDPDDRYADAHAMREAFWELGGEAPYQRGQTKTHVVSGDGAAGRASKPDGTSAGAKRWLGIGSAVIALLAVLALGYVFLLGPDESGDLGTLTITPTPSEATVFVNDERITPGTPIDVPPGEPVAIRVERDGYEPWSDQVTLEAGGVQTIPVTLEEAASASTTGTLTVSTTPADARIRVNGDRVTSDTPVEVRAGEEVSVEVTQDGYEPWSRTVTLEAGQERALTATLERRAQPPQPDPEETDPTPVVQRGTLSLAAPSGASIRVDGQSISSGTPVELTAGSKSVTVSHPQYGDWSTRLSVPANRTLQRQVYFRKKVNVAVTAEGEPFISAALFVDGEERGTTPQQLTLSRGEYTIEVRKFGYDVEGGPKTVTVEPYLGDPGAELATDKLVFQLKQP